MGPAVYAVCFCFLLLALLRLNARRHAAEQKAASLRSDSGCDCGKALRAFMSDRQGLCLQ